MHFANQEEKPTVGSGRREWIRPGCIASGQQLRAAQNETEARPARRRANKDEEDAIRHSLKNETISERKLLLCFLCDLRLVILHFGYLSHGYFAV